MRVPSEIMDSRGIIGGITKNQKENRKKNFEMNMKLRYVGIFVALLTASGHAYAGNSTVIFANVLFRHGDRTPIDPYPTDPYNNESFWPVPFGQLTTVGQQQHLKLGRWFRARYNHLLPETYSLFDIYIMSTDTDRTLMSAEANLAGLFPPRGKQIWSSIKWMPIPVHTIPEVDDHILSGKKYCPRYNHELAKVLQSPDLKRIERENAKLYDYLTKYSGRKIHDLDTINYLYDILYIERLYNMTLPKWTKSVFPEKMLNLACLSFTVPAYNKILQRLKIGSLLGEMVEHMKRKSAKVLMPDRNVWMYSAHDYTVANLLMALDVFDVHCPPYAATVLLELHENANGHHFVTISYKNSTDEPKILTMPGCLTECPLEDFVRLTKSIIPKNWDIECQMDGSLYAYNVNNSAIIAILSWSVIFLVLLILLVFAFIYSQYKRENSQYYLRLSTDPI